MEKLENLKKQQKLILKKKQQEMKIEMEKQNAGK